MFPIQFIFRPKLERLSQNFYNPSFQAGGNAISIQNWALALNVKDNLSFETASGAWDAGKRGRDFI